MSDKKRFHNTGTSPPDAGHKIQDFHWAEDGGSIVASGHDDAVDIQTAWPPDHSAWVFNPAYNQGYIFDEFELSFDVLELAWVFNLTYNNKYFFDRFELFSGQCPNQWKWLTTIKTLAYYVACPFSMHYKSVMFYDTGARVWPSADIKPMSNDKVHALALGVHFWSLYVKLWYLWPWSTWGNKCNNKPVIFNDTGHVENKTSSNLYKIK